MRFNSVNQFNDDKVKYKMNPAVKVYTLRDVGFQQSNAGNFLLKRSLSNSMGQGPRLKIVIKKNLKQFKMDITDGRGLRKVNIFDHQHSTAVENLNYIMNNLSLRKILQRT